VFHCVYYAAIKYRLA